MAIMTAPRTITIRPATSNDAHGISGVHVACWRATYSGIIPQTYLDELREEKRLPMWQYILADPVKSSLVCVATEGDGEVIGFAAGGPNRSPELDYEGEVYAIYLLKEHQGQGIGRLLFERLVEMLLEQDYQSMLLWVLTENPTRGFYEREGGELTGRKQIEIGGSSLEEVAYGWDDLAVIGK